MNKADLTEVLASRAQIPKVRAAVYINIITDAIQEALVQEEKVTISDFGTFTVSERRAFTGHNPKNGTVMDVPARRIPVFRSGKGLKGSLND
jgi:DNA-binding protein HU-beta